MTILRALAASVKLPNRVPQGDRPGVLGGSGLFSDGGTDGMEAYRDIGAAYGPIRRICETTSLIKWSVYQQTEKAGKIDRVLIDDAVAPARYPATAVLTHPNPYMTWRTFAYVQQLWQETTGGVYWLITQPGKRPNYPVAGVTADLELWPIRSDRITPIPDPENYLAGYVYTRGIEKIPLGVESVIALGWPDPFDPLRFSGPLKAIRTDLEAEKYASQYNRNVFLNDGRPGGVIEFATPLPRTEFDEFVLRWREAHQGVNNVKRVAMIEGGTWKDVGQSNTDMEYLNLRKLTREEVMFALGMPFAVMVTENVNLANATIGEKIYYRYPIKYRCEAIKEAVNERILPLLGDNLTADYELPAPEDEAFDQFAAVSDWLADLVTRDEARQSIGMDAIDNDEVFLSDITGVAPPITPAKPPRKPTTLSYRPSQQRGFIDDNLSGVQSWAAGQLERVRVEYERLLASRNGSH